MMTIVELSTGIENRLLAVSQALGRDKSELIEEAVLNFLEDFEDSQDAQFRLDNLPEQYLTLQAVEQELGLAD
jgi:predicted DNA-binding protein